MEEKYQVRNLFTEESIYAPGKIRSRIHLIEHFCLVLNCTKLVYNLYVCLPNCGISGNGTVTLHPHIKTNDGNSKGLWMFQPIENSSRNDSVSQERILITDVCRGHNYPKQFTTYQIVSVNDDSICLGVQFSPDFMEEQKCLRVLPCYKSKGNLLHTNYQ